MGETQMLESALLYAARGFSVIPIRGRGKTPLAKWQEFQSRRASESEIKEWFELFPDMNIGIVTGAISDLYVLDLDTGFSITDVGQLPVTPTVHTGGGGFHYYFKFREGLRTKSGLKTKVDARGEGGYVVAPPSVHESGVTYSWENYQEEVVEPPGWLYSGFREIISRRVLYQDKATTQGSRNDEATRKAGSLLRGARVGDFLPLWRKFQEWNQDFCVPPLPIKELEIIWESISRKESVSSPPPISYIEDKRTGEPDEWTIVSALELPDLVIPSQRSIISPYIPSQGITVLAGQSGLGKSWLLMEMARCIGTGTPFLDRFETSLGKVLYVDEEAHIREIQSRWAMLAGTEGAQVDFMSLQGFKIDDADKRHRLLEIAKRNEYTLIIFDTYRQINNKNENDSTESQVIIDGLREFNREDITILLAHHNRKTQDNGIIRDSKDILRGSNALLGALNSLVAVYGEWKNPELTELQIIHAKLREGKQGIDINLDRMEVEGQMKFLYTGDGRLTKARKAIPLIKDAVKGGRKYSGELADELTLSKVTVSRAIDEIESKGLAMVIEEGNKRYVYPFTK